MLRWISAGPVALITSVLVMAGMSAWLPAGRAGIDHLSFPIILFPAIWAALFFYAVLEARPGRALVVITLLGALNAVPVLKVLTGTKDAARDGETPATTAAPEIPA